MIKCGTINGIWEKGGEDIWCMFYWDYVVESYLKSNYV